MGIDEPLVDWLRLGKTTNYYKTLGYRHITVPWWVSQKALQATHLDSTQDGLVGSAEQSFIELHLRGELPLGRFVACSPCFRIEPVLDIHHQKEFMKVELWDSTDTSDLNLRRMIEDALLWFLKMTGDSAPGLRAIPTKEGFDIELNGFEIGSYGRREAHGVQWLYGTGVAEPRFSTALQLPQS